MDLHGSGSERVPGHRLSPSSAREFVAQSGPPRPPGSFLSTDHLSTEAAAAYVDGRLPRAGELRARAHLERCRQCRRDVDDQREARRLLRGSGPIRMPPELLHRLRALEHEDQPVVTRDEPVRTGHESPWARLFRRLRGLGR